MIARLLVVGLVIAGIIYGIGAYLSPKDLVGCSGPSGSDTCRAADAIVVVSGGDTIARTDEAIQLYQAGWAKYIVFSGAAADKDGPSNAKVMREHALSRGVPANATIIEDQSETTKQNAEQVKERLEQADITDIILVTSGYHLRRASLEFSSQLGPSFEIRRHPSSTDKQWGTLWWLTPWGWWLAIGELVKIGVFYAGGSR